MAGLLRVCVHLGIPLITGRGGRPVCVLRCPLDPPWRGDVRLVRLPWPSPFRTFLPCNMSHKVRLDLTHQRPRPDRHTAHWLCATRNKDIHNGRHGSYLCLRPSSGAVSGQCGEEAERQQRGSRVRSQVSNRSRASQSTACRAAAVAVSPCRK